MTAGKARRSEEEQIPVLYLAPWVDIGGSDKGTIDWFRFLDRERFGPSLITTQPSPNRRLFEVAPYAEELWELPQLIVGDDFPRMILSFIYTRGIRIVHIMNSRLGFELLPDIAALPNPPRVVVQLHGEEPDRPGYVRYVTTRYGNLVDAFSITTTVLQPRLDEYEVPTRKRRLIPIGVDAEREFCPERVRAVEGLDPTAFQLLFAARLTPQKDALLIVEIAARLRDSGLRFQIQVLGAGELNEAVRALVLAKGLEREVLLRGAQTAPGPWYAACDAILLTSLFETSPPRAAQEAMAMGMPVIAPDVPEFEELVMPGAGVLVRSREDPDAYAGAVHSLAADASARVAMGAAGRARVREHFSAQRMAAEHGALYHELLLTAPPPTASTTADAGRRAVPTAVPFQRPGPDAEPLVSVVIPCFNHGGYLEGCLRSVHDQTYGPIEAIVVDDGSTDPETSAVLAGVERDGAAIVIRLSENRGPGAARNVGVDQARGRYVLPLDADDLLTPNAVAELVEQLANAGEHIGFVYPNLQFFGNRNDYWEPPSYNLHALLEQNYCAVSSLIDREVFDQGFRYPEDIVLGQEDWDFVLTLAEHGIHGEPAQTKTLLCRKLGFNRNDLVETGAPLGEMAAARHPDLFLRRTAIKAEWNPALSVIALDPLPEGGDAPRELATVATRQSCPDFELITVASGNARPTDLGPRLRHIPRGLPDSRAQALARSVSLARGRYALATYGSPTALLEEMTLVEKTLRILEANPAVAAVAFADCGPGRPPLQLLDDDRADQVEVGALCWIATGPMAPPASLLLAGNHPLETLADWLGLHASLQWRHLPQRDSTLLAAQRDGTGAELGAPEHRRRRDVAFRKAPPELPKCPSGVPHRLAALPHWRPVQTRLLYRHRHPTSGRYTHTNWSVPPDGYVLERVLGCLRDYPLAGTSSLMRCEDERAFAVGEHADPDDPMLLGFIEQTQLPLFDAIVCGRHPYTGQRLLVAGQEAENVQEASILGFVEPYPIRPWRPAAPPPENEVEGQLRARVAELETRVSEITRSLEAAENATDQARLTSEQAELTARQAEQTLETVTATRTWRMTAPLRSGMGRARRMLGR